MKRLSVLQTKKLAKLTSKSFVSSENVQYSRQKATKKNKLIYIRVITEVFSAKYFMLKCTFHACSKAKNPFTNTDDKKINNPK